MMLATDLVVLDHYDGSAIAGRQRDPAERRRRRGTNAAAYHHAVGRLDAMTTALSRPTPPMISTVDASAGRPSWSAVPPAGDYPKAVEAAKEAIRAGECFQIVVSPAVRAGHRRRPARRLPGAARDQPQPVHVPAALRRLRHRRLVAGGARQGHRGAARRALLHPIAGTRPRGATPGAGRRAGRRAARRPEGARRARHAGRPRAATTSAGSARRAPSRCPSSRRIERYSHVMHIVSTVVGRAARRPTRVRRARRDLPGRHAVRRAEGPGDGDHRGARADPARAVRRHGRLLRLRRRPRHGDRDPHRAACATARAYVQAGAGIVADSDPAAEEQETRNKAAAVLAAIAAAETLQAAR